MAEAIKRIEEKEPVGYIPPIFEKKDNSGWDGKQEISSISPAEPREAPYIPSKPILDNPLEQSMKIYGIVEDAARRWGHFKVSETEKEFYKIDQTHRQEAVKLEEAYQAQQDVTFWEILGDVGNSIMSSVSFFFGFSAMSAGAPVVGATLIASGVLSVTNLVFKHTQVWEWTADQIGGENKELRQAIKTFIPPAVGILASALGIYGSYAAWIYSAQTGVGTITTLLKATGNIANGISQYQQGQAQYRLNHLHADLMTLHSNIELGTISVEDHVEDIKDFHKKQNQIHANIQNLLEQTDQMIQVIQQPV